jgi:hypothetical protein
MVNNEKIESKITIPLSVKNTEDFLSWMNDFIQELEHMTSVMKIRAEESIAEAELNVITVEMLSLRLQILENRMRSLTNRVTIPEGPELDKKLEEILKIGYGIMPCRQEKVNRITELLSRITELGETKKDLLKMVGVEAASRETKLKEKLEEYKKN